MEESNARDESSDGFEIIDKEKPHFLKQRLPKPTANLDLESKIQGRENPETESDRLDGGAMKRPREA